MDITQTLKDTENSIRDFISFILKNKYKSDWENYYGVTDNRLDAWKDRRILERKKQKSGSVDERLIYYSDFYDLSVIITKNWELFKPAFDDLKRTLFWLKELEDLRNPDAHRRELLPHQKHLIIGLAGEIRTRITKYRCSLGNTDSYFPRIEFASDNLNNSWKIGDSTIIQTDKILRPGDQLEFIVTANDPLDDTLEYHIYTHRMERISSDSWSSNNTFSYTVTEDDIGTWFEFKIEIRSSRVYHANVDIDDEIRFAYQVFPSI